MAVARLPLKVDIAINPNIVKLQNIKGTSIFFYDDLPNNSNKKAR